MVLGLGVSHQVTVENWYGTKIERPVAGDARVRRHLRAMLRRARTRPRARSSRRNFRFMGYEPRPDLPIYVAALSPKMLRLAGEIADGVMLWLCNPTTSATSWCPRCSAGRERAGKSLEGFDIVAAVPAAVTDDRAAAYETMRADLVTYWSLPFYRAMIERSGLRGGHRRVRRGHAGGRRRARPRRGDLGPVPRGADGDRLARGRAGRRRALQRGRRDVTLRGRASRAPTSRRRWKPPAA